MEQLIQRSGTGALGLTAGREGSRGLRIASWVVRVPVALMFLMAGSFKLRGAPQMVGLFEAIGIGQWFRYVTGGLELLGAVLLLVPRTAGFGGALLVPVMLGAIATHLFIVGGNPAIPIALLVGSAFVAWTERAQLAAAAANPAVIEADDRLASAPMAEVDLDDVAVFVRVVDLGAFAKAARELGVPTSTVSRTVARLEERVGTMLLRRTSRSLQPTPEGQAFYAQVAPAVSAVRAAARAFEGADAAPRGTLRVTAPNDLGTLCLAEMVVAFREQYPLVHVELVLTGRMVSLVEEGIDVAIRGGPGPVPDSSLVARKLGPMEAALYASPSYLASHGAPATVAGLADHACIPFRAPGGDAEWVLTGLEGEIRQRVQGPIWADDLQCVREVAVAGGGVALLPRIFAAPLVSEGKLTRVLRGYLSQSGVLRVVHAPSKVTPAKVAAFRDFVIESFDRLRAAASAEDA